MQFLALASIAAIVGVAGIGAASTLRNSKPAEATSEGTLLVADKRPATPSKTETPKNESKSAPAPVVQQAAVPPAATTPAPETNAVSTPSRPATRGGFVVVEGQTQLTDSIYAVRAGDSVIVNFDRFGYRTRRQDKLESSLRASLPLVYGRMATAFLDTLPEGQLVTNRDVIGALATNGMRVTLDNGATVHIRVLTRFGRDGELAVGYLTTIER